MVTGLTKTFMNLRALFLDDDKNRFNLFKEMVWWEFLDVDWAKTSEEAIELLKKNPYDFVFLDHDLTEDHYRAFHSKNVYGKGTGLEVAKFLTTHDNHGQTYSCIVIHTMNPDGAKRIWLELLDVDTDVYTFYFGSENFIKLGEEIKEYIDSED